MKATYGIPSKVLKNATKYDIPGRVVKYVTQRDKCCVYCKLRFRIATRGRSNLASWEHMDEYSLRHPKVWNITLCCGSCNASRGQKRLMEWFDSDYCKEKKITKQTVARVIQRYLGRGLAGW
jgi:hypothetical protein